jgi:hypothetical protein
MPPKFSIPAVSASASVWTRRPRSSIPGPPRPGTYLCVAADYIEAARALIGDNDAYRLPFYHLCAHALELTLKEYLLHSGMTDGELKEHLGRHDLTILANEAHARGLPIVLGEWFRVLDRTHRGRHFLARYLGPQAWTPVRSHGGMLAKVEAMFALVAAATGEAT